MNTISYRTNAPSLPSIARVGLRCGVLILSACADNPVGAELLLPEELSISWESAYNGRDDGLGALVPVDLMVYESTTGDPLPDVAVSAWTDDIAARPVPVEGLRLVSEDELEDVDLEAEPASGASSRSMRAWDATRDQFVSFVPVDVLDLRTDEGGVARMYLYVDAFPPRSALEPSDSMGFGPVRVLVSMGDTEELFWLSPR